MEKLNIEFENCYGIKKLNFEFDFGGKSIYVIYAPNGAMKTSFAKTFSDFAQSQPSKDLVFPARITNRKIEDESNNELSPEQIFVIEPYNQSFKSAKISTLLVNKSLKEEYDKIHSDINEKKEILLKELASNSGIKKEVESAFSMAFTSYPKEFFKALLRVKAEVLDSTGAPEFADIMYSKVFSDKIIAFLETKDFKTKLTEYIEKYDELIDSSTYFKKGVFNHNNATVIAKNLKDNGFFQANHAVLLNASETKKEITTQTELEELIKEEMDSILNNPELATAFEEIDKKLKANQELREFRDYLMDNLKILPELPNLNGLKQKIWISYLKEHQEKFRDLETEYSKGKEEIERIVEQAKLEETGWRHVINIFNKRFSVPFKLKVDNQEDVILKSDGPNIKFEFVDHLDTMDVEENELFKILSSGERRALYILNIIFEVEARKEESQETVFIVDDIADSFDYKNKYAIIEYLKDISSFESFKQILLTHNYDFYRTVSSRLDMERKHKLTTFKSDNGILLQEEKYQNNPFSHWKEHFDDPAMLIASIPFVRNIAEFTGDDANYLKLTSLLHIKGDTRNIKISDLEAIFKNILIDKSTLVLPDQSKLLLDIIFETADSISVNGNEIIELENKITLAIAIRLKAEEFMISKINDDTFCSTITEYQTFKLYEKYKEIFPEETSSIELLDQVNLMTPENIHINSFMYEPILDMSNEHLKALYLEVKEINSSS